MSTTKSWGPRGPCAEVSEREIIKADPKTRGIVLALLAAGLVLGFLLLHRGLPLFLDYLKSSDPGHALRVLRIVTALLFLSVVPVCAYVYRLGRTVAAQRRFPPHGMKVVKDTPLVTGDRARFRGIVLQCFAACLLVLGLSGAGFAVFGPPGLFGHPGGPP